MQRIGLGKELSLAPYMSPKCLSNHFPRYRCSLQKTPYTGAKYPQQNTDMQTWKTLHIEIDDELTDVLEKMQEAATPHVALVIPGRSLLLTSMINLRLIQKKAKLLGQTVAVVTRDVMGRTLAEKAGMFAVRLVADLESVEAGATPRPVEEHREDNLHRGKAPAKTQAKKTTHEPILMGKKSVPTSKAKSGHPKKRELPKTVMGKITYLLGLDNLGKKEEVQEVSQFRVKVTPASKKAFVSILSLSLILLVGISVFALPHATLELTPKLANVPVFSNITMTAAPTDVSSRQIQYQEISVEYEKEFEYAATGKKFEGTNAKGRVRIFNREGKARSIVGNSRLQTQEGLVFLTTGFVTVPPARGQTPGTIDVVVEARDLDVSGNYIGDRGNIGPTKFTFPALTSSSQQLLYAESFEAFSGGVTKVDLRITATDMETANKNIVTDLEMLAEEELRAELVRKNLSGNVDLFEPADPRFVSKELLGVEIPRDLVGAAQPSFKAKGKMRVRAYYYKKDDLVSILESHFKDHQLTYNQQLVGMDRSTLSFANIFPPRDAQIKVTVKMNGVVSYSFASDSDALIQRIKDNIVGADRARAMAYLQNLPEVDAVDIQLSPWWQKTLPTLKENISVRIKDVRK